MEKGLHYPRLTNAQRLDILSAIAGNQTVPVVIDTDPYNEIDDQFAITFALLSPDRIDLQAIYAAPFSNERSGYDAAVGMRLSYDTTLALLQHFGNSAFDSSKVFPGADRFAKSDPAGFTGIAIESPAVSDLINRALFHTKENPLIVAALAAITNVASAILLEPKIVDRIVVLWLGGNPHNYPDANEFNLTEDTFSARVVLDCGVPLVLFPCMNVAEHLTLGAGDMSLQCFQSNAIGKYLAQEFLKYADERNNRYRAMWDMAPISWLVNSAFVDTVVLPTPILTLSPISSYGYSAPLLDRDSIVGKNCPYHCTWSLDPRRHLMGQAIRIDREAILKEFFGRLNEHS
jgi:purine nucleosidase